MNTTRDGKAKPSNDGSWISLRNPMQLFAGDISQWNECRCFSQQESHNRKPPEHSCAAEPCQATLGSEVLRREREGGGGGGGLKRSAHIAMQFLVIGASLSEPHTDVLAWDSVTRDIYRYRGTDRYL